MPVSHMIGGLPILSKVFDHGVIAAASATFILLFVITYVLLCYEQSAWLRVSNLYFNFSINDTIVYPIYMATATYVLNSVERPDSFLKSPLWHGGVLVIGVLLSVIICRWEVRVGKYSTRRQLSLWKIWHTIMFSVVFYWVVSTVPMVLLQNVMWATSVVVLGVFVFLVTTILDGWMPGAAMIRRRLSALRKGAP